MMLLWINTSTKPREIDGSNKRVMKSAGRPSVFAMSTITLNAPSNWSKRFNCGRLPCLLVIRLKSFLHKASPKYVSPNNRILLTN